MGTWVFDEEGNFIGERDEARQPLMEQQVAQQESQANADIDDMNNLGKQRAMNSLAESVGLEPEGNQGASSQVAGLENSSMSNLGSMPKFKLAKNQKGGGGGGMGGMMGGGGGMGGMDLSSLMGMFGGG